MTRLSGPALAAVLGAVIVAGCGAATQEPAQAEETSGELTAGDLADFPDFPLYGLPDGLDGLELTAVSRISPRTLDERGSGPIETLATSTGAAESGGRRVVADFVDLIYGDCDASEGGCAAPLSIQVWRACNRYLDDYELAPGTPYPHEDLTVRGTQAAGFGDRIELYAGSVTVVIFAQRQLALRAAEELKPLNESARAESAVRGDGLLPLSDPGPDCSGR